ncbi:MAG: MFS transporter, partial [Chitinophagaceae bacterium]|nr:MFS transporter [Chitinophagaceae bacterium]
MFKNITRTVFIISLVSLFNDFSSEMLYPVMPLYLAQIGYGGLFIGILEGMAELIAGLTKIYTGSLSDSMQRRLPFVNIGYALSVLSRPLMVASHLAGGILAGRSIDKVGKGIRTGARDALLADECNLQNRAEVFGFHRSMDTLGAILGPLTALIYLHFYPEDYKTIFLITFIPGVVALGLTFRIKEKKHDLKNPEKMSYSLFRHFS